MPTDRHRRYNTSDKGKKRNRRYEREHRTARREAKRNWQSAHRHASRGSPFTDGNVTIDKLYERDGGICQLGNHPCFLYKSAFGFQGKFADQASIDHIQPVSEGGPHTWENVRLACVGCNAKRNFKERKREPGDDDADDAYVPDPVTPRPWTDDLEISQDGPVIPF